MEDFCANFLNLAKFYYQPLSPQRPRSRSSREQLLIYSASLLCMMFHLSPLHRIDQGVDNWDMKMYRFWQFCMLFSILIEFFFGFSVLDDFFYGFAISYKP